MATAPEQAAVVPLALDRIRTDGGTQMRVDLSEDIVEEYAQIIRAGTDLPPIVVFLDGTKHWLADGFHRFFGYRKAGAQTIQAEVRQGTKRDAILYSVGANASHGLRRTNEDKRKAVLTLLGDKEWSSWPQTRIAVACGVSREFVNRLSQSASSDRSQDASRTVERNGATYQQNTANIGGPKAGKPPATDGSKAGESEKQPDLPSKPQAAAPPAPALATDGARDVPGSDPALRYNGLIAALDDLDSLIVDDVLAGCPPRQRAALCQRVSSAIDFLGEVMERASA